MSSDLTSQYRKLGDLGAVAAAVLPHRSESELSLPEVESVFRQIAAARGSAAKTALARELLARATPLEAKYVVKIMTGDLRIGLKESLVEEAIAKAYGATLAEVQRANMLLGDIGETLRLAAEGDWAKPGCGCFIPWDSCWRVRWNRRKRPELFSRMQRSRTNTTASVRRRTFRETR